MLNDVVDVVDLGSPLLHNEVTIVLAHRRYTQMSGCIGCEGLERRAARIHDGTLLIIRQAAADRVARK